MISPDEFEKLYEEALWCLYALQDDLLQKDNPYIEEDRETISTCELAVHHPYTSFSRTYATGIKRTKLRLVRCRVRMGMNERDRLRDANADVNLSDVPREPPPWEVPVLEQQSSSSPR